VFLERSWPVSHARGSQAASRVERLACGFEAGGGALKAVACGDGVAARLSAAQPDRPAL
jgi:hypothetical protein